MQAQMLHSYRINVIAAYAACTAGNRDASLAYLTEAMRLANKSKDARYRRAVFRALSFTRRIPV
jgi:hypothetical protein